MGQRARVSIQLIAHAERAAPARVNTVEPTRPAQLSEITSAHMNRIRTGRATATRAQHRRTMEEARSTAAARRRFMLLRVPPVRPPWYAGARPTTIFRGM